MSKQTEVGRGPNCEFEISQLLLLSPAPAGPFRSQFSGLIKSVDSSPMFMLAPLGTERFYSLESNLLKCDEKLPQPNGPPVATKPAADVYHCREEEEEEEEEEQEEGEREKSEHRAKVASSEAI